MSSFGSFLRFVMGFTLFLTVSLALTVVVNNYATERDEAQQQAAALSAMLGEGK